MRLLSLKRIYQSGSKQNIKNAGRIRESPTTRAKRKTHKCTLGCFCSHSDSGGESESI